LLYQFKIPDFFFHGLISITTFLKEKTEKELAEHWCK